jgi:DNA-binding CsgD family transcriptional regulator
VSPYRNADLSDLTERQWTIVRLAGEGFSDKEISDQLSISRETVRTHWRRLRERLGATNRTQVVVRAIQAELTQQMRAKEAEVAEIQAKLDDLRNALFDCQTNQESTQQLLEDRNKTLNQITFGRSSTLNHLADQPEVMERLDMMIDDLPVFIVEGDLSQNWKPHYVSRNHLRLAGYDAKDLIAGTITVADFVDHNELATGVAQLYAGMEQGERYFVDEFHIKKPDGDLMGVRNFTFVSNDPQGRPKSYISLMIPTDLLAKAPMAEKMLRQKYTK